MSDAYFEALSSQKIMQNELYLTMIYRPVVTGKRFVEKSTNIDQLQSEQDQAVDKIQELAGNVEAVLKDYSPYRLGMYEASNGVVFSEALEFFGYLLNRIDEPVPVLQSPVHSYLPVSRHMFSDKTGDFIINTPNGVNHFGAILNIKEYHRRHLPGHPQRAEVSRFRLRHHPFLQPDGQAGRAQGARPHQGHDDLVRRQGRQPDHGT